MASQVSICNGAIIDLGGNPITSMSESSREAILCSEVWDDCLEDLLEEKAWSFAVKREELAEITSTIPQEYTYGYALPSDCLKPLYLEVASGVKETDFRIEGQNLYTDWEDPILVYVWKHDEPAKYPAKFRVALSALICARIAMAMTKSRTIEEQKYKLYQLRLTEAKRADAQAQLRDGYSYTDSWETART